MDTTNWSRRAGPKHAVSGGPTADTMPTADTNQILVTGTPMCVRITFKLYEILRMILSLLFNYVPIWDKEILKLFISVRKKCAV